MFKSGRTYAELIVKTGLKWGMVTCVQVGARVHGEIDSRNMLSATRWFILASKRSEVRIVS